MCEAEPLTIRRADTFRARAKGLLGVPHLDDVQALWLAPCRAVHTFGMRFAIDVVFLDARGKVLRIVPNLPPYRLAVCLRAASVLELAAGTMRRPSARARIERAVAQWLPLAAIPDI